MKYTAKIKIGWLTDSFSGDTATEIMQAVEQFQDFDCLMSMGRSNEGKKGQKELDKLSMFLDKYYSGNLTIEDIQQLDVRLSIGCIKCLELVENDDGPKQ